MATKLLRGFAYNKQVPLCLNLNATKHELLAPLLCPRADTLGQLMPGLIKKPCQQLFWRVGPVMPGSSYAPVREDFPVGVRLSSRIHQAESFLDRYGTLRLLPLLLRVLFHRDLTRGLSDGASPVHRVGEMYGWTTSRLDEALRMKRAVGSGEMPISKFAEQGSSAHRSGDR